MIQSEISNDPGGSKYFAFLPQILLALIYLIHAIQAIFISEEFVDIVMVVGFNENVASILVFIVGIIDFGLAVLLLVRPLKLILVYVALWPLIPAILSFVEFGEIEPEFVLTSILAYLIYSFRLRASTKLNKMEDII